MSERPPKFTSKLPETFTENLSKHEKWLYENADVARQQNEHLIGVTAEIQKEQKVIKARLAEGDKTFSNFENRLKPIENHVSGIKRSWSGLWTLILIPVIVALITALLTAAIQREPKPVAPVNKPAQ